MVNALVLYAADSPPAPACRTVKLVIDAVAPRSTWRYLVLAVEHHLSLLPPETLPLTAFSGPSVAAHGADPVAGQFSARLTAAAVAGAGTAFSARRSVATVIRIVMCTSGTQGNAGTHPEYCEVVLDRSRSVRR